MFPISSPNIFPSIKLFGRSLPPGFQLFYKSICTCISRSAASNAFIRNTTCDQNRSSTSSLRGETRGITSLS
ncbi:hypothetical protein GIB67_002554 [Kingdonia uniflora]|uniref:Uncharacterized protein n=1 Tax=Kingdonia uniflora TaxID=39325 RepID=A0A7J7N8I9_9MAGN|nr:hypothetical protein GIB67_002554 [Kingdonia uniflora]